MHLYGIYLQEFPSCEWDFQEQCVFNANMNNSISEIRCIGLRRKQGIFLGDLSVQMVLACDLLEKSFPAAPAVLRPLQFARKSLQ